MPMSVLIKNDQYQFSLQQGINIIGRIKSCDIQIPNKHISRQHLSIDLLTDGSLTLMDLGSSNGLMVKGQKVSSAILQTGESFTIGTLVFLIEES